MVSQERPACAPLKVSDSKSRLSSWTGTPHSRSWYSTARGFLGHSQRTMFEVDCVAMRVIRLAISWDLVEAAAKKKAGEAPTTAPANIKRSHEHPVVEPQVVHFRQVPLRTSVSDPQVPHGSPSYPLRRASATLRCQFRTSSR